MEVETAFDAFKNTLEADRTYMQNDQSMEGWMFINYLALLAYWRILKLLVKKELLSKFSIKDVLDPSITHKKDQNQWPVAFS